MSLIEKSCDMEQRYAEQGNDSWGNRERQLYQRILKKAVEICYDSSPTTSPVIYDIGAGGGNVCETWIEHCPSDVSLLLSGCDISPIAVEFLNEQKYGGRFELVDLEEYGHQGTGVLEDLRKADLVSIVDVMYYFGDKRPYKETLDEIWATIKPGAIVLCADSLIPYQRRSYFSTKPDCEIIADYTDYTEPVSVETRKDGRQWHRYLKCKIYRKRDRNEQ